MGGSNRYGGLAALVSDSPCESCMKSRSAELGIANIVRSMTGRAILYALANRHRRVRYKWATVKLAHVGSIRMIESLIGRIARNGYFDNHQLPIFPAALM